MNPDNLNYYCVILTEKPVYSFNLFAKNEEEVYAFVKDQFESDFFFISFAELKQLSESDSLEEEQYIEEDLDKISNAYNYFISNIEENRVFTTDDII